VLTPDPVQPTAAIAIGLYQYYASHKATNQYCPF